MNKYLNKISHKIYIFLFNVHIKRICVALCNIKTLVPA